MIESLQMHYMTTNRTKPASLYAWVSARSDTSKLNTAWYNVIIKLFRCSVVRQSPPPCCSNLSALAVTFGLSRWLEWSLCGVSVTLHRAAHTTFISYSLMLHRHHFCELWNSQFIKLINRLLSSIKHITAYKVNK